MKTKRIIFAIAILAGGAITTSVNAASVSSLLPDGVVKLSDNSAEYLIKGTGNTGGDSIVEVGDSLRGITSINTFSQGGTDTSLGATSGNWELTGLFEITVTGKYSVGDIMPTGATCTSVACFTFGASTSFATELASMGWTNTTGATVAFWEDSANDYNRELDTGNMAADIAAMEATATGGDMFWLFGTSIPFDFWIAGADSADIGLGELGSALTPFGNFSTGLSLLEAGSGPDLGLVNCTNKWGGVLPTTSQTNTCGQGGLLSKGDPALSDSFRSAYDSFDNVDFNINIESVPEPSVIVLLGMGLLGLGFSRRKAS